MMAPDSLNALAVVLASVGIGAVLEWVWQAVHFMERRK
jgi:hypothetical protein